MPLMIPGRNSLSTAQLSKGISHSYELGIEQTQWRWKDRSTNFATITGIPPNSSWARIYGCSKLAKNSHFPYLAKISKTLKFFPKMKISNSKPLQLFRIAGCYNISPLETFVLEWGCSYKIKGAISNSNTHKAIMQTTTTTTTTCPLYIKEH